MKYYYDLHLHSCLSPCGSEDMTPANLAAMCALAGLDIVALTDHNTTRNCPPFCRAAAGHGLLALAGMELCTQEDIHVVCLFPSPEEAAPFDAYVSAHLSPIQNQPDLFGPQIRMGDEDEILEEDCRFLAGSTDIPVYQVAQLVAQFGGVAIPAHIDRPSYSLLGVLGLWDPELTFSTAELSHNCPPDFIQRPDLNGLRFITGSDAHYLEQVWGAEHSMDLPERSPQAVLHWLSNKKFD